MTRRMIKFPLKMKNGAEVRSLEDLRENADVESIMKYYFSGQLSLWCKAFGYQDISTGITEINETFVKSIMDLIGVTVSVKEMQEYLKSNFGISNTTRISADAESKEEIIDDAEIKAKLKDYTDVNLDDYEISAVPVENESGKIKKYRISVTCKKTEQYTRFFLPYDVKENYTKECFEYDLHKKIAYLIADMQLNHAYNSLKNSKFSDLKIGDTFEFGSFQSKPIRWKIIKKTNDTIYVISDSIICSKPWDDNNSNVWEDSSIRKWLNGYFFDNSFSQVEKMCISDARGDKISLLTLKEFEEEPINDESDTWWLRSPYDVYSYANLGKNRGIYNVRGNHVDREFSHVERGIRPTFILKF